MQSTNRGAFAGTMPVSERNRFDRVRLEAYLRQHIEGFGGPLEVEQFRGGQSNPTFRLTAGGKRYVLRRKPPGKLLPSAHAVDREYRVMTALRDSDVPVPRTWCLCNDESVIGTAFFVMDCVDGRIFWDPSLPEMNRSGRAAIFAEMNRVIAALHKVDFRALGLVDYGKTGNYLERQIARWTKQYRASETQHIPEFEKLAEWLPKTVPPQDRVSIVHGDYRLDNMIFHPTEPRVQAVLDWELSTLGDPMADFTYLLMQWTMPGLANVDLKALNIPSMDEAAQIYCNVTGSAVPDLNWYFSYNLFRLAGITQGIAGRVRDGTAANAKAMESAKRTVPLSQASWEYAQKAGAK
jgi:aminoglycoside phosphotransferase (APT) family kinase protein